MKPKIYSDEITSFIYDAILAASSSKEGRISPRELADRVGKSAIPVYSPEFKDRLYREIVGASSSEEGPLMVYDLAEKFPELGWDLEEDKWSFEEDHARAESAIREVILEINQGGQRFIAEDSQGYLFPSAAVAVTSNQ